MKPKSKAQLDRAADLRLQKTYNITLADYGRLFKLGEGGCWICGRLPLNGRRLHVDHDHSHKKVAISYSKIEDKWGASAEYNGSVYISAAPKKSLATKDLKRQLLRASVRGLLCYQHNAGLQKFSDSPVWLQQAAKYLQGFLRFSPLSGREAT